MNISGLIRSFVGGDLQAAEPKKLELKTGEVVKGVVQQLLPNDEAMLNIGGVQLRAKLETPLKQGEVTMFQVQPESSSGQIVLKPLSGSGLQIADSSMSELLKNVGLQDTSANRQLIQALHQAGIPLAKETVQAFAELQTKMPGTLKQEEWLPSAIVAFQKGVPLTPDSVAAVRQTMTGPAFHETLRLLETQISNILQGGGGLSASSKSVLEAFQQILSEMRSASGQVMRPSDETAAPMKRAEVQDGPVPKADSSRGSDGPVGRLAASLDGVVGKQANAGSVGSAVAAAGASGAGTVEAAGADQGSQPGKSASSQSLPAAVEEGAASGQGRQGQALPAGTASQAAGAGAGTAAADKGLPAAAPGGAPLRGLESDPAGSGDGELTGARPAAEGDQEAAAGPSTPRQEPAATSVLQRSAGEAAANRPVAAETMPANPAAAAADLNNPESVADTAGRTSGSRDQDAAVKSGAAADSQAQAPNPNGSAASGGGSEEHWLSRLVKSLGIEHESSLFKLPEHGRSPALLADRDGAGGGMPLPVQGQGNSPEPVKMTETLKGALLQMMQADDIPASLKETAQQAVQHITGQQLLLNSDKASMFSHITLFVPLMNANGEQTAAIHIQSRKGKRGEIDARNCRLVFDLRMKTLGDTMVDVQVVDRIVSLQVHNNQPYIPALLEAHRDDIAASLSGIGYQFISLKCSPYPELRQKGSVSGDADKKDTASLHVPLQAVYGSKPYRGMDVRV